MEKTKRLAYMLQMMLALLIMIVAVVSLPALSFLPLLMMPMPIVLFANKWDIKGTIVLIVFASIVSILFIGPIDAMFLGIYNLMVGLTYAWGFKHKKSASKTILYVTIGTVLYSVVLTITQGGMIGVDKAIVIDTYEQLFSDPNITALLTAEQVDLYMKTIKEAMDVLAIMTPFILLLQSFVVSLITYYACRFVLKRHKLEVVNIKPFKEIRFPDSFIYGMFFMIVASYILTIMGMNQGEILLQNIFVTMYLMYGIVGMAVIYYMASKKDKGVMGIILIVGFTIFGLWLVLVLAGMIDAVMDMRKIRVKPKKN